MMLESQLPMFVTNGVMTLTADNLTGLLIEWREGDRAALDKLTPLVYDELRRIAHRYVQRERNGHTLGTTALVNEAYLRLAGQKKIDWQKSRVVALRYFGGLGLEETADALEISVMTVRRDWRAAKAWLYRRMKDE